MAQNVLAVVAGHQITEEELQAFIGHLPKEQQAYASNPQFKEHCKEQLITFHALAKCGEDEKFDETEEYRKGMDALVDALVLADVLALIEALVLAEVLALVDALVLADVLARSYSQSYVC